MVVATAIADTYRSVSSVSAPNIRRAAPAKAAASGNSAPVAWANFSTPSVISSISVLEKPNLDNSICRLVASEAVYFVVSPKRLASAVKSFISPLVVPNMAASLLFAASKSIAVLIPCLNAPISF